MPTTYAATNPKKFLDADGLAHFAQKLNNYPTNDVISAVIDGVQDALDEKMDANAKGTSNGVASLDSTGKVPQSQLPSDIIIYDYRADFPLTGIANKLYIGKDESIPYIWDGSQYVAAKVTVMTGASSSAAGTAGLVPAPASGQDGYFLRGDGTWVQVTATVASISDSEIDALFT